MGVTHFRPQDLFGKIDFVKSYPNIRVRGGDAPERIIAIRMRVVTHGLGKAERVRVQTAALIKLTGGECISGLTVEGYSD